MFGAKKTEARVFSAKTESLLEVCPVSPRGKDQSWLVKYIISMKKSKDQELNLGLYPGAPCENKVELSSSSRLIVSSLPFPL